MTKMFCNICGEEFSKGDCQKTKVIKGIKYTVALTAAANNEWGEQICFKCKLIIVQNPDNV